jgi:Bacterial mobilisation protein (MobC)
MTDAPEHIAEVPPAAEALAIIRLPPPAADPSPPPQPRRRRVKDPRDAWLPATRCTKEQREQADAEAERAGMSLNAFMRWRMFGTPGPRSQRNPSEATKVLAQILAQMGKRGSNLNQIAHRLNLEEVPAPGELGEALAEHRECVAAIMRALGLRPDADYH